MRQTGAHTNQCLTAITDNGHREAHDHPVTFFPALTQAGATMLGLAGHQGWYDSLPLSIP